MGDGDVLARSPMFNGEQKVSDAFRSDTVNDAAQMADPTPRKVTPVQEQAASDYEGFTVQAFPVSGASAAQPSIVLGEDAQRSNVTIVNAGTDPVVIGKLSRVQNGQGFLLPAGASLSPETVQPIYCATAAGFTTINEVSVWVERDGV